MGIELTGGIRIAGASGYLAFSDGRIYSSTSKRFVSSSGDKNGYIRVALVLDSGGTKTFKAHRVILDAFFPNPDRDRLQVNHKDGNKKNNWVSNLEWVSGDENIAHAIRNGFRGPPKSGLKNSRATLTKKLLKQIFEMRLLKIPKKDIEEKLKLKRGRVVMVCCGRRYGKDFLKYRRILISKGIEMPREYCGDRVKND